MKKYYWLIVGLLIGASVVAFSYWTISVLTIGGSLNIFSVIGVVVVYTVFIYLFGYLYDSMK